MLPALLSVLVVSLGLRRENDESESLNRLHAWWICSYISRHLVSLNPLLPAAADIPVESDNPAHYVDAIRYNARTPLQGSLLPLTRLVWA